MPNRILIIGIIYCLWGGIAICSFIAGLFNDSLHINFSAFMLLVGIGLLKGRRSSLVWARVWVGIGYLLTAIMVGILIFKPASAFFNLFGIHLTGVEAIPYIIVSFALFIACLVTVDKLLRSEKARAYCRAGDDGTREDRESEPIPPDALRNAAAYYAHRDAERRKAEAARTAEPENP